MNQETKENPARNDNVADINRPAKPVFGSRFFDKLIVTLLYFLLLVLIGKAVTAHQAGRLSKAHMEALGKSQLALSEAWNVGIKANLAGCIISLFIVYLLRTTHFAPIAELVGAMAARFGIPLFALFAYMGWAGQDEYRRVFNQWAQFYIVVVYLASLPLDVWMVLPEKKRFSSPSSPWEAAETTLNPTSDAPGA